MEVGSCHSWEVEEKIAAAAVVVAVEAMGIQDHHHQTEEEADYSRHIVEEEQDSHLEMGIRLAVEVELGSRLAAGEELGNRLAAEGNLVEQDSHLAMVEDSLAEEGIPVEEDNLVAAVVVEEAVRSREYRMIRDKPFTTICL